MAWVNDPVWALLVPAIVILYTGAVFWLGCEVGVRMMSTEMRRRDKRR